jgi:ABC-type dipeptide/oligopeptide/nickel transport system permease component
VETRRAPRPDAGGHLPRPGGPAIAALISGSFVVEQVFQIPGLGFYFVASIADRDYALLTGALVFYSTFLVILNLLVDIAYGFLDPRIRERR